MLLGTTQNYNLGFRIYLEDHFSNSAANAKNTLQGLKDEHAAFVNNLKAARAGFALVGAAGMAATKTMMGWINVGAKYDDLMVVSKAVTQATADEMARLNDLAKSLAGETIFFPEDIASGIRFMGMAGQSATTILKTLRAAVNLTAAQPGLQVGGKGGGADILTNILKGFDLPDEYSEIVADILTQASVRANVTVTDLGNSLKYAAATATDLKVPLEDATSLLMALGNAGIQGSMAGTALENMMRYLTMAVGVNATKRQTKALEAMGLSSKDFQDARGDLIPLIDALSMMRERLEGRGTGEIQNILKEIFGVRGKRSGSVGIRMLDDIIQFNKMLKESTGRSQEIMTERMNALYGNINKVLSAWEKFKVEFTEAVKPLVNIILKGVVKILTGLKKIVSTPFGKVLATLSLALIPIVSTILLIKAAVASMILLWKLNTVSIKEMNAAISMGVTQMFKMKGAASIMTATNVAAATKGKLTGFGTTYRANDNEQVKYSAKRGMYYVSTPGKAGIKWLPKETVKYSAKRGMYYGVNPAGKVTWVPKSVAPTVLTKLPILSRIGGILGKALGFLMGPWGMAIMLGVSFLPSIFRLFKKNNDNQEEIKNLLKPKKEDEKISNLFSNREWYEAVKGMTFEKMLTVLQTIEKKLIEIYGVTKAAQLSEGLSGMEILAQLGPLVNTRNSLIPINNSNIVPPKFSE